MNGKNFVQFIFIVIVLFFIGLGISVVVKKDQSVGSASTKTTTASEVSVKAVSSDDHVLGDVNASVTLIEYSDYQCPYCIKHYPTMKELVAKYPGKIRWVFRSFPLSFHKAAEKASEAAEAAGAQNKFWEYSDILIQNSQADGTGLAEADLIKYAEQLNLNMDQFKSDLSSGKYASKVKSDQDSGTDAGVEGTPATFLIGKDGKAQLISGAVPFSQLETKINEALK